jgi:hypothetical protein
MFEEDKNDDAVLFGNTALTKELYQTHLIYHIHIKNIIQLMIWVEHGLLDMDLL